MNLTKTPLFEADFEEFPGKRIWIVCLSYENHVELSRLLLVLCKPDKRLALFGHIF